MTYLVIDMRTGAIVGRYRNRNRALGRADRLDQAHGAYRYTVRPASEGEDTRYWDPPRLCSQCNSLHCMGDH